MTIDGTTQSGWSVGTPVIEIRGDSAGTNTSGLDVLADNVTIEGLVINRFDGNGIVVSRHDDVVQGNFIGTGTTGLDSASNGNGIDLLGATSATVGGLTTAERNVVSGNRGSGVLLDGGTTSNLIEGNYLGVGADGATGVDNSRYGVDFIQSANNTLGGTVAGAGNVIGKNDLSGIEVFGSSSTGNKIEGNFVGTNSASSTTIGNTGFGLFIWSGASGNIIGGTASGAGNVISENSSIGVYISGTGANSNVVAGNFIGTDSTGELNLTNHFGAVAIESGASGNTIGGATSAARNVISDAVDNTAAIQIQGSGTSHNVIENNYVGIDAAGTTAIATTATNAMGILINQAATRNTIGGSGGGLGNVISGNSGDGIDIADVGTSSNLIAGNFIGTDTTGTTAVANGSGVVIFNGASTNTVGGAAAGNVISGNKAYGVLLTGSGSGNAIEGNFIGTDLTGTTAFDSSGNPLGNFIGVRIDDGSRGNTVGGTTALARNIISGNLSDGVQITGSGTTANLVEGNFIGTDDTGTITVDANNKSLGNNTGVQIDSGASANIIGGTTTVVRNIISGNTGFGVGITGLTTAGNVVAGNWIGIASNGTAALGNGDEGVELDTDTHDNTIGGAIPAAGNVISGNTFDGVGLFTGATANIIQNNLIGTDPNGASAISNNNNGITLNNVSLNQVLNNVVSGNGFEGVELFNAASNAVAGNFIGTNAVGTVVLPNAGNGVSIAAGSADNTVGGTTTAARNIISGNTQFGVFISDSGTSGNVVEGNFIGTDSTGTAALGNGTGVQIISASGNIVGGSELARATSSAATPLAFKSPGTVLRATSSPATTSAQTSRAQQPSGTSTAYSSTPGRRTTSLAPMAMVSPTTTSATSSPATRPAGS